MMTSTPEITATPDEAKPHVHIGGDVTGVKCEMCDAMEHENPAPMPMDGPMMASSPKTFEEYDALRETQATQSAIDSQFGIFDGLYQNIRYDPEMTVAQKAQAMQQLAAELEARVAAAAAGEMDGMKATKRDGGVEYQASDYADVPDPDKPSTWKLLLAEDRSGNFTAAQVGRAITALQPGGFRGNRVDIGSSKQAVISRIQSAIGKVPEEARANLRERLSRVKSIIDPVTIDPGMLTTFKDATGRWRWIAVHSNRYVDREGEIFSERAHKAFVEEAATTGQYPALRLFHVPYDIGRADMLDYVQPEGFVLSSGTFAPGMDDIAKRLSAMKGLGCSHGFTFRPADFNDGVYERYRSFEVTVLPREYAANPLTVYVAGQEVPVGMSKTQKDFLTEVAGPERVALIEEGLSDLKAFADEHGLAYKSIEDRLLEQAGSKEDGTVDNSVTTSTAVLEPPAVQAPAAQEVAEPPAEPAPEQEEQPDGEQPEGDGDGEGVETVTDDESAEAKKALAEAAPTIDLMEGIKSAFAQALAPIAGEVEALRTTVAEQAEQITALKATRDQQMADAIRPRIGPSGHGVPSSMTGAAPTAEEAEAIDAQKAKPVDDPLEDSPVGGYMQDLMRIAGSANGRAALMGGGN